MEKRSNRRRLINTSIVCNRFNSLNLGEPIDGKLKNCSSAGFYAELKLPVKAGTILVVRVTGRWGRYSIDEGFRSHALAEVRWSKPISAKVDVCYATGLKYLMAY